MGRRGYKANQTETVVDSTASVAAVFAADAEQLETSEAVSEVSEQSVVVEESVAVVEAEPAVSLASISQRWRVMRKQRVSLMGSLTTLNEGDIISAASYGEQAFSRLLEQGVELVPF